MSYKTFIYNQVYQRLREAPLAESQTALGKEGDRRTDERTDTVTQRQKDSSIA